MEDHPKLTTKLMTVWVVVGLGYRNLSSQGMIRDDIPCQLCETTIILSPREDESYGCFLRQEDECGMEINKGRQTGEEIHKMDFN